MKIAFTNKQLGRIRTYVPHRDPFWKAHGGALNQRTADREVALVVGASWDTYRPYGKRRATDTWSPEWLSDREDAVTDFRSGQHDWWQEWRNGEIRKEQERMIRYEPLTMEREPWWQS